MNAKFNINDALGKSREDWLLRAVKLMERRVLMPAGIECPAHLWVSVGFPRGARGKAKAIGQCWPRIASKDKTGHIFISPVLEESSRVLDVLLHEVGHDVVGCEHGHKKPFADFCRSVGLVTPWTATTASPELKATLDSIVTELGAYPHPALTIGEGMKKQNTRMRLYQCGGCDQKVRAASDSLLIQCIECDMQYEGPIQKGEGA